MGLFETTTDELEPFDKAAMSPSQLAKYYRQSWNSIGMKQELCVIPAGRANWYQGHAYIDTGKALLAALDEDTTGKVALCFGDRRPSRVNVQEVVVPHGDHQLEAAMVVTASRRKEVTIAAEKAIHDNPDMLAYLYAKEYALEYILKGQAKLYAYALEQAVE